MEAFLHCLRKNCFLEDSDDEDDDNSHAASPRHLQVDRDSTSNISYQPPAPTNSDDADDGHAFDDNDDRFHHLDDYEDEEFMMDVGLTDFDHHLVSSTGNDGRPPPAALRTVFEFLQQMGDTITNHNNSNNAHSHNKIPNSEEEAIQFEKQQQRQRQQQQQNDKIPTIASSEVVMPGSKLQKMMSEKLKNEGYGGESVEDECVICMEGFDETNPRMPTLCGCGANKTYFHLPCLYHWIEQSKECPSCRKELTWEEF